MASGGGNIPFLLGRPPSPPLSVPPPLPPHPTSSPTRSWARIVSPHTSVGPEPSPILLKEQHEKLKASIHDFVSIDPEFHARIHDRMQSSAYAKFLGKSLPLHQLNQALQDAWRGYGTFSVADMPNEFYFIRCQDAEILSSIMYDGPWTVAGMVLQIFPWKPNFQPAFERLSSAAVWLQFHHLPMEIWHFEMIESVASKLGRLLKIDDATLNASRAKFARVCIELDLSQPLKQGNWVGFGAREVLVTIQYERHSSYVLQMRPC